MLNNWVCQRSTRNCPPVCLFRRTVRLVLSKKELTVRSNVLSKGHFSQNIKTDLGKFLQISLSYDFSLSLKMKELCN